MIVTLMWHIVDRRIWSEIAVSEEAFEGQLAHLRREGYELLTLDEVVRVAAGDAPAPERGVLLTFDDGYENNLRAALPRLREHGAEATVFVPTAAVGGSDRWNARPEDGLRYMDWQQLEQWLEGGGRIGGHTHGHETAGKVADDVMQASIERGRRLLEERLGVAPVAFAYPNGAVTKATRAAVARHYDLAWTVIRGTWYLHDDPYRINRFGVGRHAGIDEFARELDELFESFGSRRVRIRRRIRGPRAPDPPRGPRVGLVVGRGEDDPGYAAGTRFADLLAAGVDAHLLHTDYELLEHRSLDGLGDDVLRARVHPPPEHLQRLLPRADLLAGLARRAVRHPVRTAAALTARGAPGTRYLRAMALGLGVDVVHVRGDWPRVGDEVVVREGDGPDASVPRAVDRSLLTWPDPAPEGELNVLAVAPLTWASGLEHLLEAVASATGRGVPCNVRIVGTGGHESALWFARHQLGLDDRVELYAPSARPGLVEHLRWAHVIVNAALEPATPSWLIHAQAAGRPLVTTPLDGDEPGLVVPPGDAAALAAALVLVATDEDLCARLVGEARARSSHRGREAAVT